MAKSFKETMQKKAANPTLQFITTPVEDLKQEEAIPAPRALPEYGEETKSRRLQLLLTPSLYDGVKAEAQQRRISVNELINTILKDAIRK